MKQLALELKYLGNFQKAGKGSYVVVWGKNDYKSQADKQLSDTDINEDLKFNEKNTTESFGSLEVSNIFLKQLNIKASLQKRPYVFHL